MSRTSNSIKTERLVVAQGCGAEREGEARGPSKDKKIFLNDVMKIFQV